MGPRGVSVESQEVFWKPNDFLCAPLALQPVEKQGKVTFWEPTTPRHGSHGSATGTSLGPMECSWSSMAPPWSPRGAPVGSMSRGGRFPKRYFPLLFQWLESKRPAKETIGLPGNFLGLHGDSTGSHGVPVESPWSPRKFPGRPMISFAGRLLSSPWKSNGK